MRRDLSTILVRGIGKQVVSSFAVEAAEDESFFNDLLDVIEQREITPSMKASWIISTSAEINQQYARKNSVRILTLLKAATIGGVQRELIKTLSILKLNEDELGILIDYSFQKIAEATSDLAIKYHAAHIIEKSLAKYPELKTEYISLLEGTLDMHTEAWRKYTHKRIARLLKQKNK